jgi:hypothetical protein
MDELAKEEEKMRFENCYFSCETPLKTLPVCFLRNPMKTLPVGFLRNSMNQQVNKAPIREYFYVFSCKL